MLGLFKIGLIFMALTDAGLTIAGTVGGQVNLPPVIISTPDPSFVEGTANTYDMSQDFIDDGQSTVITSLLVILPNGLSYDGNTHILTYDGIGSASVSQHQLQVDDQVNSVVTSSSFDLTIINLDAAKKWHPGHYMQILRSNSQTVQSVRFGYYDSIASETALQGVVVPFRWEQLEGSKGDYSAGITLVQSELNYLKALTVPKRLIIRINDHAFSESFENTFPSYLNDEALLYTQAGGAHTAWRRWNSTAMGYFIDMWEAYAAEFDDEPYLESIYLYRETAPGPNNPGDYSSGGYNTQTRRLIAAGSAAFTKTNVIMPVNYFASTALTDSLFVYMEDNQVGTGGPDTCSDCGVWGDRTLRGISGGVDYRGVIPAQYSVEVSELGLNSVGPTGGYTPQEIYDFWTTLNVSHGFWDRNTFAGTSGQQWSTGILPFIQANPNLVNEGAPSIYTQGVDTS